MRGLIESEHMQQESEYREIRLSPCDSESAETREETDARAPNRDAWFLLLTSPRMVVKRGTRKPGQPMQINGNRIKAEVDWSRRVV